MVDGAKRKGLGHWKQRLSERGWSDKKKQDKQGKHHLDHPDERVTLPTALTQPRKDTDEASPRTDPTVVVQRSTEEYQGKEDALTVGRELDGGTVTVSVTPSRVPPGGGSGKTSAAASSPRGRSTSPSARPRYKAGTTMPLEGEGPTAATESRTAVVGAWEVSETSTTAAGKRDGHFTAVGEHIPSATRAIPSTSVVVRSAGGSADTIKGTGVDGVDAHTMVVAPRVAAAPEGGEPAATASAVEQKLVLTVMAKEVEKPAAIEAAAFAMQESPNPIHQPEAMESSFEFVSLSPAVVESSGPYFGMCEEAQPSAPYAPSEVAEHSGTGARGTPDSGPPCALVSPSTVQAAEIQALPQKERVDQNTGMIKPGAVTTPTTAAQSPLDAVREDFGRPCTNGGGGDVLSSVPVALNASTSGPFITMRKPYCLSPAHVAARTGSGIHPAAAPACGERERLAARIHLMAEHNVDAVATPAASPMQSGRSLPLGSTIIESGFGNICADLHGVCGNPELGRDTLGGGGGGLMGATRSPVTDDAHLSGVMPSSRGGSPERGLRSDGSCSAFKASHGNVDCKGGAGNGGRSGRGRNEGFLLAEEGFIASGFWQDSPPSSRFHFAASETKTAPLCSAGGSTSLYEGAAISTNTSGGGGAWCFAGGSEARLGGSGSGSGEAHVVSREKAGARGGESPPSAGLLRPDEEQPLAVRYRHIETLNTQRVHEARARCR